MVKVQIEVVALKRVSIHTGVDRVKIDVFTVVTCIKMDNHLERREMIQLENHIFSV